MPCSIWHYIVFSPLGGHPRGDFTMYFPLEGHVSGHFTTFSPLEGHLGGHFTTFSPLKGHPGGHFIMFSPLEGHPRHLTHVHYTYTNNGTQLSASEQQCFLSVACHLFNKHLHMNNSLHSVFILCPAERHRNHFYWQNAFILFIHYLRLYLLIFCEFNI